MNKGTHFIGQPMYGQLLNLLDKSKILRFSRENGGERYVKHFDAWQHLVIMLYAVIKRFDSLREITDSMFPEARKLSHLGISLMPRRSTLSDANARRKECVFEAVYRDLYDTYKDELSSDSRRRSPNGSIGCKSLIQRPSRSSPTSSSRVWAAILRAGRRREGLRSTPISMPTRVCPRTSASPWLPPTTASCSAPQTMSAGISLRWTGHTSTMPSLRN